MLTQNMIAPFSTVQKEFTANFKKLVKGVDFLFVVDVTKEELWNTYLNSFPEEDGIRQSFNCNACKSFIRKFGGVVAIKGSKFVSVWDFESKDPTYQQVISNLNSLVKSKSIKDVFYSTESTIGIKFNGWHHWYVDLPSKFVKFDRDVNRLVADTNSGMRVFKRAIEELSDESFVIALELIAQNSLESGSQFKSTLELFLNLKMKYAELKTQRAKECFLWLGAAKNPANARIYNSAIGTFLRDLSDDVDIETAVVKFGKVMNPLNYKRPKAIVTSRTLKAAEETIEKLGLMESLNRRLAVTEDVSINNMLWADRNTQTLEGKPANIFQELSKEVQTNNIKQFKNVKEVPIQQFLEEVLPTAKSIEYFLEERHRPNLVSLIAPSNLDAPAITKWDNGFSWTYAGGLADSIKEKVKAAGGEINARLRCSLGWFNYDDLDIHLYEPDRTHINYQDKKPTGTKGQLDIDMNAGGKRSRTPVENIFYPIGSTLKQGVYKLVVNQFTQRENVDVGFEVEIEFEGDVYNFSYPHKVRDKVTVAEFEYRNGKFKLIPGKGLEASNSTISKEVWGLNTNQFQKVTTIMYSPNHWDDNRIGNEHLFLMLEGAENKDDLIRGFLNEQLKEELMEHKRVFETLGGKMVVEPAPSERQLTGIGFQLTKSNNFLVKVTGSSTRIIKVVV